MPLTAGSIAFVGFNADGTDNLAFVVLEPIVAGTQIHFTDDEWTGSALNTGESRFTWTAGADIAAGTVVTLDSLNGATPSSSHGSIAFTAGAKMDIGTSNEFVYAYVGRRRRRQLFSPQSRATHLQRATASLTAPA